MGAPRKKNPQLKEKILEVVEQFYFENYRSPSLAEIAAEIGVVRNTVHRYLYEMDRDGTLKYDGSCIKTPKTDKADFSSQCAPVVGRISCGPLEEAEEDLEEFVALPTALFGSGDFMILRASGESMIERGIDSGDLVVIEKNVTPRDGDIVAIREGSGNTLKQFFYEPDKKRIKLHPWNSTMKDIYLHDVDNVQIYGVARKVIKEL